MLDLASLVADYSEAASSEPAPNFAHDFSLVSADIELLKTDVQW